MMKSKHYCHCDFCQQENADEIRNKTPHLTPNYSVTAMGYPSGTHFDHLSTNYKPLIRNRRKMTSSSNTVRKNLKERACASCEEYWITFVDWVNNVFK
jgi:hypothetical protein